MVAITTVIEEEEESIDGTPVSSKLNSAKIPKQHYASANDILDSIAKKNLSRETTEQEEATQHDQSLTMVGMKNSGSLESNIAMCQ